MADEQNPGAAGASMTPQAATEQRAALMADPAWRSAAMDPKSTAWGQIAALDQTIAAGRQAAEDADDVEASARTEAKAIIATSQDERDEAGDAAALAAIHQVPERPGQYSLPTQRAQEMGLPVDAQKEIALREAFARAQVPQGLAQTLYFAAITAAKLPDQSPAGLAVSQAAEYIDSSRALHQKWGAHYDANLAAANAEARLIFEKLPASMTKGVGFADWCRSSGIANNRVVVEQLASRAKARKAGGR